ncbi:MAG: hypothetical protein JRE16_03805 [Deltaproteobacteria bacterium]|jgi:hypothetical protein|nr:hypothetical protein [Deltaproteobacteria bacterium]
MSDGLLEEIIRLEKQIQQQLIEEERRVEAWQKRELDRLDETLENVHDTTRSLVESKQEAARKQAGIDGQALVAKEEQWCARLKGFDDQVLREALTHVLPLILPEEHDDHSNGQS